MLLNQLLPASAHIKSAEPALNIEEAEDQLERLALAPAAAIGETTTSPNPKTKASPRKAKAVPEQTSASGKRTPLLPAYAGLTRVEAIAQLLQATPDQDLTIDQISEGLFGRLRDVDHKAERKSLNTQLCKGQSQKLWQKGTAPGTFTISAPTPSTKVQPIPKAPATAAKSKSAAKTKVKAPAKAKAKAPRKKTALTQKQLREALREADIKV